jgi:hypothetical protein
MFSRRNPLKGAAAVPLTSGLRRGLAAAAEARKQIKITCLETKLLRVRPSRMPAPSTISAETALAWFCASRPMPASPAGATAASA